jgi:hypothetical protein
MTTTARSDIHRPSAPEFDPEAYQFYGVFDTRPEPGSYGMAEVAARREAVDRLIERGFRFGAGSSGQCGHCGARIRYAALMVREDAKQFIFVGETCLDGRFEMTKAEFSAKRKAAALDSERIKREKATAAFFAEHPEVAWLAEPETVEVLNDSFIEDLAFKAKRYGSLSTKQIAAAQVARERATKRAAEMVEREATKAALVAAGVKVPDEGRIQVAGKVLSAKWVENDFGGSVKLLVESDAGWKVWGTAPSSIAVEVEAGDRVEFMATVEPSSDDPLFGFYKRPTKAQILGEV